MSAPLTITVRDVALLIGGGGVGLHIRNGVAFKGGALLGPETLEALEEALRIYRSPALAEARALVAEARDELAELTTDTDLEPPAFDYEGRARAVVLDALDTLLSRKLDAAA